ncbi:uncharacterized protein LOC111322871 [Stylophora pistillata]|nr:uncharacterized protein LOC111322871 [Stylophora pistillata]XP_022781822.1 uncharacterized protein LOC111322871 [Stylophora pistillata]XP_022781823.1 uncharacterized protein LOC111322871 [Stylophora pistillata]
MWQQITYLALLLGIFVEFTPSFAAEKTTELQDDYSSACPPGYWCKKKREFDMGECPRGFICRSTRSTLGLCPPGYWCRRSELVLDQPTDPKNCAAEYWCKVSRDEISQSRSIDSLASCPPGYWCRKKRSIDLLSSRSCPRDFTCSQTEQENDSACPPGYWCKKKRSVIQSETEKSDCPRSFWCKRKAAKSS